MVVTMLITKHGFIFPSFERNLVERLDTIIASYDNKNRKHNKVLTKRHWRNGKVVAEIDLNKHLMIITRNGIFVDAKMVQAGANGNLYERVGILKMKMFNRWYNDRCFFYMKGGCYTILEQTRYPEKVRIFQKGILI